jgi:hypothetical protein
MMTTMVVYDDHGYGCDCGIHFVSLMQLSYDHRDAMMTMMMMMMVPMMKYLLASLSHHCCASHDVYHLHLILFLSYSHHYHLLTLMMLLMTCVYYHCDWYQRAHHR